MADAGSREGAAVSDGGVVGAVGDRPLRAVDRIAARLGLDPEALRERHGAWRQEPAISHSSLDAWGGCPARWYIQRFGRVKGDPGGLAVGLAFHGALEAAAREQAASGVLTQGDDPAAWPAAVREAWEGAWVEARGGSLEERREAHDLLAWGFGTLAEVGTILGVEERFRLPLVLPGGGEVWITGAMDLVAVVDGVLTVRDYKTGRVEARGVNAPHDPQLNLYAWAARSMVAEAVRSGALEARVMDRVRVEWVYPRSQTVVGHTFTASDTASFAAWFAGAAASMLAEERFVPTPTPWCGSCQARMACPSYALEMGWVGTGEETAAREGVSVEALAAEGRAALVSEWIAVSDAARRLYARKQQVERALEIGLKRDGCVKGAALLKGSQAGEEVTVAWGVEERLSVRAVRDALIGAGVTWTAAEVFQVDGGGVAKVLLRLAREGVAPAEVEAIRAKCRVGATQQVVPSFKGKRTVAVSEEVQGAARAAQKEADAHYLLRRWAGVMGALAPLDGAVVEEVGGDAQEVEEAPEEG